MDLNIRDSEQLADRVISDERLIELLYEKDDKIVDLEKRLIAYRRSLNTIGNLFREVQAILK